MRHTIYILVILLMSGCSLFGNKEDSNFGTWKKVSSSQGDWIGISGKKNKTINPKYKALGNDSAYTVEFDTLLLNNPNERFELALDANVRFVDHDGRYKSSFFVVFSDHETTDMNWRDYKFISDSLAFTHIPFDWTEQQTYFVAYLSLTLNCGYEQDKEEYLSITYGNVDSTNVTSVKLRVDGLYALASDVVPCYNLH